jgi:hypothetical protein
VSNPHFGIWPSSHDTGPADLAAVCCVLDRQALAHWRHLRATSRVPVDRAPRDPARWAAWAQGESPADEDRWEREADTDLRARFRAARELRDLPSWSDHLHTRSGWFRTRPRGIRPSTAVLWDAPARHLAAIVRLTGHRWGAALRPDLDREIAWGFTTAAEARTWCTEYRQTPDARLRAAPVRRSS